MTLIGAVIGLTFVVLYVANSQNYACIYDPIEYAKEKLNSLECYCSVNGIPLASNNIILNTSDSFPKYSNFTLKLDPFKQRDYHPSQ
jgi:hypothetical protein